MEKLDREKHRLLGVSYQALADFGFLSNKKQTGEALVLYDRRFPRSSGEVGDITVERNWLKEDVISPSFEELLRYLALGTFKQFNCHSYTRTYACGCQSTKSYDQGYHLGAVSCHFCGGYMTRGRYSEYRFCAIHTPQLIGLVTSVDRLRQKKGNWHDLKKKMDELVHVPLTLIE